MNKDLVMQNSFNYFKHSIEIFKKHNINWFAESGTALGCIRHRGFIPWDHDIDIAVWADEISQEKILKIMKKKNFKLREGYGVSSPDLSFNKNGGRIVDFNFYEVSKTQKDEEIAQILWPVPKNYLMKLIHALSESGNYNGKFKQIINSLSILKNFFKSLKLLCIKKDLFYKMRDILNQLDLLKKLNKQ